MKQRYFCAVVAAVAALMCIPGCSEESSSTVVSRENTVYTQEKSPAAGAYGGKKVVLQHKPGENDTSESSFTPFQTFTRMTELFGENGNGSADENSSEEPQQTEAPVSGNDDNAAYFGGTWYRFHRDGETYTTAITMYEHIASSSGLKDSVKEPDRTKKTTAQTTGKPSGKTAETTKAETKAASDKSK